MPAQKPARRLRAANSPARWTEALESRLLFASNSFDLTFNGTGLVAIGTGLNTTPASVVTLPDGKVLVAGTAQVHWVPGNGRDFLVQRYNANGTPDLSFGNGSGGVTTDFGGRNDVASAIVLTGGGKFAVVGSSSLPDGSSSDFAVARYNADGSLDKSFSGDGKLLTDINGPSDQAKAAALTSDGKLLVVGTAKAATTGAIDRFALARYTTSGAPDTTFGGGTGKAFVKLTSTPDRAAAVAVLPNGKFVIGGVGNKQFMVARFNINGTIDSTFGGGKGWASAGPTSNAYVGSMAVLSNGKILLAGSADRPSSPGHDMAVARFNADGTIDNTFGNPAGAADPAGFAWARFAPAAGTKPYSRANAMQLRPDGKILVAGTNTTFLPSYPARLAAMARFTAGGSLDTTFSGDGKQLYDFTQYAYSIAAAPSGKTVVAGMDDGGVLRVARFQADYAATASIAGVVYNDVNRDGTRDTGESGLANWQVYIDTNGDGFLTPGEQTATTDANGAFRLAGLVPGTYRIREVRPSGWERTQPAGAYPLGYYDVIVSAVGQSLMGRNFGNRIV